MIIIKTPEEIEIMREGGKRLAEVLNKVKAKVRPGISTKELDDYAFRLVKEMGDRPAFLNYQADGAGRPYPASLCVSVEDEVVHGIPKTGRILKEGDIVSLDFGIVHRGLFTDSAITVPVGSISPAKEKLLRATEEALYVGIDAARGGKKVGDIGYAIESFVKTYKYGIVDILSGHGVGRELHEDPYVPNFGRKGTGELLKPGQTLAIEPMLNMGVKEVIFDDDGWTFRTADGKPSAHFEHTILITDGDPEILTKA